MTAVTSALGLSPRLTADRASRREGNGVLDGQ